VDRPKQKHPRYHLEPGRVPVRFAGGSIGGRGCIRNLSQEGMYLEVDHLPPRKARVLITLEVPGRQELQVRARVVWHTELRDPDPVIGEESVDLCDDGGFGVMVETSEAPWRKFFQSVVLSLPS
jgi:hypothetical protein